MVSAAQIGRITKYFEKRKTLKAFNKMKNLTLAENKKASK